MRTTWGIPMAAGMVVACGLFGPASHAESKLVGQVAAPRLWYVDWSYGGIPLNEGGLLMLNYTADYADWQMQILGGYGSGWESDELDDQWMIDNGFDPAERKRDKASSDRFDIQWQLGRRLSLQSLEESMGLTFPLPTFFVGAAYHYIEFDFEGLVTEADVFYHGPEFMLGLSQKTPVDGLFLRGNVTVMPYVQWTTDNTRLESGGSVDQGETDGYLYDLALVYQSGLLHLAGGYRSMKVSEDDQLPNGTYRFAEDSFSGGYIEIGVHW